MIKVKLTKDYLKQKAGEERIVSMREFKLLERLGIAEKPKKVFKKKQEND